MARVLLNTSVHNVNRISASIKIGDGYRCLYINTDGETVLSIFFEREQVEDAIELSKAINSSSFSKELVS